MAPQDTRLDPRKAMLQVIQSRRIDADDGHNAVNEGHAEASVPNGTGLDLRQAMLQDIQSRNIGSSINNDLASGEKKDPPKPHLDARSALLSAIQARKNDVEDGKVYPKTTSPLDARSALLDAIKARQVTTVYDEEDDEDNDDIKDDKDNDDEGENDPRRSMLAAIRARNKD